MNKLKFRLYLFYLLLGAFTSLSFAQSDYATVQKFKRNYEEIKQQIGNANSSEDINRIRENVQEFTKTYASNSSLLNKALYPEKYEDMMAELNFSIATRESDFNVVENLQVEVSDLKQKVDTISVMNNELGTKLAELQTLFNKNIKETSRLKNVIEDLKIALHNRDALVMDMVDSLMPPVMREKLQLSSEDKEKITSEVEKDNILANVKTTIRDNIKYLDLTSLQPEDIEEIQAQQEEFADTWARIGPKLAGVYSDNKNRTNDLSEIDSLFNSWTHAVKQEVWQSMKEDFASKGIDLNKFSDGEEFTNAVNQYIENEKNSIEEIPQEVAEKNYVEFAENTWNDEIKPKWVFFLINNGMLDMNKEKVIEQNLDIWKSEIYPSTWWLWIIVIGIVLAGLALLLIVLKGSSKYDAVGE